MCSIKRRPTVEKRVIDSHPCGFELPSTSGTQRMETPRLRPQRPRRRARAGGRAGREADAAASPSRIEDPCRQRGALGDGAARRRDRARAALPRRGRARLGACAMIARRDSEGAPTLKPSRLQYYGLASTRARRHRGRLHVWRCQGVVVDHWHRRGAGPASSVGHPRGHRCVLRGGARF